MGRAISLICAGAVLASGCGSNSSPGSGSCNPPPFVDNACRATCSGGTAATFRTCTPPGTPQLVDGHTVGPTAAPVACVRPRAGATTAWNVQPLGVHGVGSQVGFNVPACTGSISIVSQAVQSLDSVTIDGNRVDNNVVPTGITDATGVDLLDLSGICQGTLYGSSDPVKAQIWNGGGSPSTSAVTFPNTTALLSQVCSDGSLHAGSWTLKVDDLANDCAHFSNCSGGGSSGSYDITVITKPVAPATGTVDVAFYLIEAGGFTSATAKADAANATTPLGRMISSFEGIFANAGLCLGTVTFYSVPAWAQSAYATNIDADQTGPCSTLSQMFANLAQPGNTLNLFLVSNITSSTNGGNIVVGIDGTIPGPSAVSGTIHSGAAVSVADLNKGTCLTNPNYHDCGADEVAYIAAHEGGHWLGLFHTTELAGDTFDSLSDTGTCPCTSCKPAGEPKACGNAAIDYQMGVADCMGRASSSCAGGDDLMFWVVDAASRGTLSAQQGLVMRANPLVQ